MRISDWSSDVCSSDLRIRARRCPRRRRRPSAAPPVRAPCARGLVGLEARGGSVATGPSPTIQAMARLAAGSSGSADGSDDVATTTDAAGDAPPLTPRSRLGSALLGIGIGAGVGVACIAIAFSIIAIPLYVLASTEPGSGLDRTLRRRRLFP